MEERKTCVNPPQQRKVWEMVGTGSRGRVWDGNEAATAVLADGKSAGRIENLRHNPIEPLTPQPIASTILTFDSKRTSTALDCGASSPLSSSLVAS